MLKPIEALQEYAQATGMEAADLQRKQEKLLDALLHPTRADHGENEVVVFAHGAEAMRLAAVKEDGDRFPHWAVQSWSVTKEDWLTQKSYDMKPEMRNIAYMDAKNWYPAPTQAAAEAKWAAINSDEDGALERLFDSRAKLAEFWYETKVIDWEGRYGGDPWFFMSEVAETAFEREGQPNPILGEKYGEKVTAQLANFASDWGELATPVLSGTLRRAGTNEVEAIVQYRSADEAIDDILQSGHDAHLRAAPLGEAGGADRSTYLRDRDAGLSRAELVASLESFIEQNKELTMAVTEAQPKEDSFLISIYYERWTHDDKDAGEPGERGVEVERETVDADDLERYGRDYGMSEPSASDPRMTPHIWFNSTSPREDREHFEQGIDKFYSLHVHEVNGHEPEAEDYQKVANLIGVKFDRPIELVEDKQRDPLYGYYINLDERGDFYADVRDADGSTVFEIRAGESLGEDESSIFEDGFMRDKHDLSGLTEHLRSLGVIPQDAEVLTASEFEQRLEAPEDDDELSIG